MLIEAVLSDAFFGPFWKEVNCWGASVKGDIIFSCLKLDEIVSRMRTIFISEDEEGIFQL